MNTLDSKLSVLTFGAGALGTYISGSLILKGHQVVVLERPEVVETLRSSNLHLILEDIKIELPFPRVVSSIEEAINFRRFDLGIFALKSYDTREAIRGFSPFETDLPSILCMQNGVDNEPQLAAALGWDRVIHGTVTSAVRRNEAGDVALEKLRGIGIANGHELSNSIHEVFNNAGLNPRLYKHPVNMKWSKLLANLLANASSAILDMPPDEIFSHPGLYRIEIVQLREALKVMQAQNIYPVDLPRAPIRALAFAVRNLPIGISRPFLKFAISGGRGGKMPSFHIDLHNKRGKSEVDYLNGAVVRAGSKLGIPTPVNDYLNRTLLGLTSGSLSMKEFAQRPAKLLSDLGQFINI
jgi:2-dehydropantoate 2-reductase